jgi:AraC family transcriptional regulator, regulatory protein of adaptative response / methylated-DNA-[protein]-cysteine methyltransferase
MLDISTCEGARQRRGPAYDGRFFVAVKTTMIYCRSICTAKMPLSKNVTFYPSAAAAELAGYRPCLRCRPETAPFCPAWKGTGATVERALKLIDAGALDQASVEALAARLGIGSRHLSRLFDKHLGASPRQVARTLRVQRAKRLIDEIAAPIAEIAARSGFRSVRRMNAAFSDLYGQPPSALRRRPKAATAIANPNTTAPAKSASWSGGRSGAANASHPVKQNLRNRQLRHSGRDERP